MTFMHIDYIMMCVYTCIHICICIHISVSISVALLKSDTCLICGMYDIYINYILMCVIVRKYIYRWRCQTEVYLWDVCHVCQILIDVCIDMHVSSASVFVYLYLVCSIVKDGCVGCLWNV